MSDSGKEIDFDMFSDEGREKLTEQYVYWIQQENESVKAYLKDAVTGFKEISLSLCQIIWPNVYTRKIKGNERIVQGKTIPIIPHKFYRFKKLNQEKSKKSRARKSQRVCPTVSIQENIAEHFNLDILPRAEELKDSVLYRTEDFFTSESERREKRRKRTLGLRDFLRKAQQEEKQMSTFEDITSYDDLRKHKDYTTMVGLFNYFFPT